MRQPRILVVAAWLFIALGVAALVDAAGDLVFDRQISLDPNIVQFWIGRWLLDGQPRGRRWGLIALRINFVLIPAVTPLVYLFPSAGWRAFGRPLSEVPWLAIGLAVALIVGIQIWQYYVLQRADVRAVFSPADTYRPSAAPAV